MIDLDSPDPKRHLRLDMDWRWHRPKRRPRVPKGEPRDDERPVRCEVAGKILGAPAADLPFADNAFESVDCGSVFAFVRNDEGLAAELARIVASGGCVSLMVPSTGLLAGLDAFNLHRYLVDITKRGLRPFETAEIGWRRHYGLDDIVGVFNPVEFDVVDSRRTAIGASELVRLTGFALFRWLRPSRNRYRRASRLATRVLNAEQSIEWPHGYWLNVTLRKR